MHCTVPRALQRHEVCLNIGRVIAVRQMTARVPMKGTSGHVLFTIPTSSLNSPLSRTPPAVLRTWTMLQVAECKSHFNSAGCQRYFALHRAWSGVWATQYPIRAPPVAFSPEFYSFHATYEITSLWNRFFVCVHSRRYTFWAVTESFPAQHKVNIKVTIK